MGVDIFKDILSELFDVDTIVNEYVGMLDYKEVFNCQESLQNQIGIDINPILAAVFWVAFYLLALKFAWKCFNTYILGADGNDDAEPVVLVVNFAKAIIISLCFGVLFTYLLNISSEVTGSIMNAMHVPKVDIVEALAHPAEYVLSNLGLRLLLGIYTILAFILQIKFVKNAVELVILRIGVSFSVVGLLDSDGGVFKPYTKKFFQICFSVIVQSGCFKMSAYAVSKASFIWAFALLSMALTAPAFLQEFIMTNQGGGGKLQQALYSYSILRSFTRKA